MVEIPHSICSWKQLSPVHRLSINAEEKLYKAYEHGKRHLPPLSLFQIWAQLCSMLPDGCRTGIRELHAPINTNFEVKETQNKIASSNGVRQQIIDKISEVGTSPSFIYCYERK